LLPVPATQDKSEIAERVIMQIRGIAQVKLMQTEREPTVLGTTDEIIASQIGTSGIEAIRDDTVTP
jgi:hypothetical protein